MILKLYNDNTNLRDLDKIIDVLKNGGLIIYPTDTLYAIGCDALNVRAVER
ncbi:MAG: L-threonylcarbamoyladenylate synthase, partial [Bacteroidales bacterium]